MGTLLAIHLTEDVLYADQRKTSACKKAAVLVSVSCCSSKPRLNKSLLQTAHRLATQTQLGKVMIPTQIIYWVQLQMYHKREKNMLIENSHAASATFFFPPVCANTVLLLLRDK